LRPEIVIGMNFDLTWGDGGHVNHVDHRAVGLGTLDACRDAANEWMFTDLGGPWNGVKAIYIHGATTPTHYVDVTSTIEAGVSSLREHRAYIQALGTEFDPDDFLRKSAAQGGSAAGCDLAVLFRAFNSG
jgi:LmbE family N-acetylglucosaminyl deacetylase